MVINSFLKHISQFIEDKCPNIYLNKFQEFLLKAGIFTLGSDIIALGLMVIGVLEIIFLILGIYFNINFLLMILIPLISVPSIFITYLTLKGEKRLDEIENTFPDFLRQLSSMLKVGLSFENAMEDLSKFGSGELYDEIRRTVIEIKLANDFEESWLNLSKRLNSKNLERTFKLILESRKSGGGLANILDDISDDLRAIIVLKRERKSSVMMTVMFLIISAVIAAPFALGMIGIYSTFLLEFGKQTSIIDVALVGAGSYIIIHSILVSLIIGLILYGNYKKGFKFSIPLTLASFGVFYIVSNYGSFILSIV